MYQIISSGSGLEFEQASSKAEGSLFPLIYYLPLLIVHTAFAWIFQMAT
jgi:hypothetical protein